jgi:hypothetical protein
MINHKADEHSVGLHTIVHRWSGVRHSDEFKELPLRGAKPLSFQIIGEFGGAVAGFTGSLDNEHWHTLKDVLGVEVELRSPALVAVSTRPQFIAPWFEGAGPETNLTFMLLVEMPQ